MTGQWLKVRADRADEIFGQPMRGRLESIRDRLGARGYDLKLDVLKTTTIAVVNGPMVRAKSTYPSVEDFIAFEERRLAAMDADEALHTPRQARPDLDGSKLTTEAIGGKPKLITGDGLPDMERLDRTERVPTDPEEVGRDEVLNEAIRQHNEGDGE